MPQTRIGTEQFLGTALITQVKMTCELSLNKTIEPKNMNM
jgi:hypothetical protein